MIDLLKNEYHTPTLRQLETLCIFIALRYFSQIYVNILTILRCAIHTEGDKSEEHLNPSLTDDISFREALDEPGASHRHLLFGKLN